MADQLEIDRPLDEDEDKIIQKPKKKVTEKQKEIGKQNLAKGRAILAEKKRLQKEEAQRVTDELIVKKAERLVKQKANKEKQIKQVLGDDIDDVDEVEERIIKKPKKKKIIYREESDSEEEVIVKRPPPKQPIPEPRQETKTFRINFC